MQGLGSVGGEGGRAGGRGWEECAVESKLLKSLIHFRGQTKRSSYQRSFILSAGGMPLQRGPETAAVETPVSTLDGLGECGRHTLSWPPRLERNSKQLSSPSGKPGGAQ